MKYVTVEQLKSIQDIAEESGAYCGAGENEKELLHCWSQQGALAWVHSNDEIMKIFHSGSDVPHTAGEGVRDFRATVRFVLRIKHFLYVLKKIEIPSADFITLLQQEYTSSVVNKRLEKNNTDVQIYIINLLRELLCNEKLKGFAELQKEVQSLLEGARKVLFFTLKYNTIDSQLTTTLTKWVSLINEEPQPQQNQKRYARKVVTECKKKFNAIESGSTCFINQYNFLKAIDNSWALITSYLNEDDKNWLRDQHSKIHKDYHELPVRLRNLSQALQELTSLIQQFIKDLHRLHTPAVIGVFILGFVCFAITAYYLFWQFWNTKVQTQLGGLLQVKQGIDLGISVYSQKQEDQVKEIINELLLSHEAGDLTELQQKMTQKLQLMLNFPKYFIAGIAMFGAVSACFWLNRPTEPRPDPIPAWLTQSLQ